MQMMSLEQKPVYHWRKYLIVFFTLWLSGCMGQVNIPEDRYYRLPDVSPDQRVGKPRIAGTLQVEKFQMSGIPNTRAILYVDPSHPNELKQYHYRHWVDSPPKLINTSLVSYLRETDVASRVETADDKPSAESHLKGKIIRFERVIESDGPKIVVKMEISFESTLISGTTKTYQAIIPTSSKSMDETVLAFGEALKSIYQSLVEDIAVAK